MIKRITLFILFLIIFSTNVSFAKTFYTITIDGAITHFTYKYIEKSIKIAEENNGVLLIKLDTPGGLLNATRDIVQLILESESPIVTYVHPQGARAGSAGAFIVLASHVAVMAEGTNIGAAHPVNLTGKDIEGDMKEKIIQDTQAFVSAIAEKRGRNEEIAKKMVVESLSLKSSEALEKGLVDYVTNNIGELVKFVNKKYNYEKEYELKPIQTTSLEKIAFFLSDPNIIVLLLLAGILAIFLEIKMPGTFVFAALGIACIILFLIGISIIPINYLALLLILAGIALVIAEVFIPSFGLLTLSAIIALASGLYLFFEREGTMGLRVSLPLMIIIISIFVITILSIGFLVFKDMRRKSVVGLEKFIGRSARVIKWSEGRGKVMIDGEIWDAIGKNQNLSYNKDDIVNVIDFKDMYLIVE